MYDETLREAFPYSLVGPERDVQIAIDFLFSGTTQHSSGSSFAVTADAPAGSRKLWLSRASFERLKSMGMVPDLKEGGEYVRPATD